MTSKTLVATVAVVAAIMIGVVIIASHDTQDSQTLICILYGISATLSVIALSISSSVKFAPASTVRISVAFSIPECHRLTTAQSALFPEVMR